MKKKIVSMLLALTLVVTGIPYGITTDTVSAAEISENSVVLSGGMEKTEDNDALKAELHAEAGDFCVFNVSENGKAVGSDGVAYDDVTYLSADTVSMLNIDAQNAYAAFCDDIAATRNAGDDLEDVVAAVDENGTLVFHYSIPIKALEAAMDELAEGFLESVEDVRAETEETKETVVQTVEEDTPQIEEEKATESIQTEEAEETRQETQEEVSDDEAATEETASVEEETGFEEASIEKALTEETTKEDEETKDAAASEVVSEEAEEALTQEASEEETVSEEETEAASEESVLKAENMELIPQLVEEHFPVVENVKADLILDLGYNNAGSSEISQLNSILPSNDWFSKQLTKNQATIFKACEAMGKGTNKFKLNATRNLVKEDFNQAISAYIMTEPYKCDWMDLSSTGSLEIMAYYYSKSDATWEYEVTVSKSKYYNAALNKNVNAKVLDLAAAAQAYALENYANAPVYGIVKYFDKWICENNYYNYIGVTGGSAKDKETQEIYYYCHSSYGILLKGYGVCESYALAMTRLLDAIGIPNMYATGLAVQGNQSGGHAWNYIQMPNENWYLHDSTWNDDERLATSTQEYLLCADDGCHIPVGNRYKAFTDVFAFVTPAAIKYKPANESITLSKAEINLKPQKTEELTYDSKYISNENVPKVWSSSDEKVAKVDKNGKVTAVGAGSAEITLTAAGMSDTCTVNVHQIDSVTFENGGKASLTTSYGIESGSGSKETQHILLTVNQKAEKPVYTAEELNQKHIFDDFDVKSSNESVAKVSHTLTENTIDLAIQPKAMGKTTITITFGTKKATLNVSVSEKLNESWFDLNEVKTLQNDTKLMYTGKAYKPKVTLTSAGKDKKVKFKVSYLNNKDAGTASVVITGTGTYGGELKYDFTIKPLELKVDPSSIKVSEKSVYNGGVNLTKSTVKHINEAGKKVGLKAGKDYDIQYTNTTTKEKTTQPVDVGTYTMEIVGKGNYAGGANKPVTIGGATWKIEQSEIKKVKVTVKVNGTTPTVTVTIGKNELPETDYNKTFYEDKECTKMVKSFAAKKQYFVKVEAAGSNITMGVKSKPIVKSFKTK